MRQKRSKTYRRLLASYILHFGFRPPFQLLIDAPFALSLSALHLNPSEADRRLSDVLQTSQLSKGKKRGDTPEMKCLITQCCMVELYKGEKEGTVEKDAVQLAKSWERRRCNHREAVPGDECLKSVIGPTNKHRYILASDSKKLRAHLRDEVAGIPLVHTNQSRVIVLEPMTALTKERIEQLERSKLGAEVEATPATLAENVIVPSAGDGTTVPSTTPSTLTEGIANSALTTSSGSSSSSKGIVRGGNRPKAPNPLSNRKPKKVLEQEKVEREKRTKEIAQRTEANRLKRLQEQEHETGSADVGVGPDGDAVLRKKRKAAIADEQGSDLSAANVEQKQSTAHKGRTSVVDDDDGEGDDGEAVDGVGGEGNQRKKRRKRGGRGAGGAKASNTVEPIVS